MADDPYRTSEPGWPHEIFLPPCADCDHDVVVHKWYPQGVSRRRCQTGGPDGQCPCRAYRAGDPKDWPVFTPRMF